MHRVKFCVLAFGLLLPCVAIAQQPASKTDAVPAVAVASCGLRGLLRLRLIRGRCGRTCAFCRWICLRGVDPARAAQNLRRNTLLRNSRWMDWSPQARTAATSRRFRSLPYTPSRAKQSLPLSQRAASRSILPTAARLFRRIRPGRRKLISTRQSCLWGMAFMRTSTTGTTTQAWT